MATTTLDWEAELRGWLEPFLERLGHKARRRMCPLYVSGLIGPGDRKSVQPMAERLAPNDYDQLHHFIAGGVWDLAPLERELLIQADRLVGGSDAELVIDDTAVPKKGKHSVGVAAQYASALGKNANCQTLVSLTLARGEVPVMVALRLFLPETWTSDPARLKRTGVPINPVFNRDLLEIINQNFDPHLPASNRRYRNIFHAPGSPLNMGRRQTQWLDPGRGISEEKGHLLGWQRAELTIEHCYGDPLGIGARRFKFDIGHRFVGMDVRVDRRLSRRDERPRRRREAPCGDQAKRHQRDQQLRLDRTRKVPRGNAIAFHNARRESVAIDGREGEQHEHGGQLAAEDEAIVRCPKCIETSQLDNGEDSPARDQHHEPNRDRP